MLPTPVTYETFTYLRTKFEQNTALDSPGTYRIQKLANATEKLFADRVILLDENASLFGHNNEKTARQSVRSTMVGKARIMSYEAVVEALGLEVYIVLSFRFDIGGYALLYRSRVSIHGELNKVFVCCCLLKHHGYLFVTPFPSVRWLFRTSPCCTSDDHICPCYLMWTFVVYVPNLFYRHNLSHFLHSFQF